MKNKILSLILTLCMLLCMFPLAVGTTAAEAATADLVISKPEELIALMKNTSDWGKSIALTADIDLTGKGAQSPIGNSTTAFTGTFDGQGHTVSGVDLSGTDNVGFFGVAKGATIRNLTLAGKVTATGQYVGGFVGYADLTSEGTFTLTNCVNKVNVSSTGKNGRVGGLIGYISKLANVTLTVSDCANYGEITGTQMVGGLAGRYESGKTCTSGDTTITCFANYGKITATTAGQTGGVFGLFTANTSTLTTISMVYNEGAVRSEAGKYTGGIAGYYRTYVADVLSMTDAYNKGAVYGKADAVGGIIGAANGANIAHVLSRLYNAGEVTFGTAAFIGAVVGANAANAKSSATGLYSSCKVEVTNEAKRYVDETIVTLADTAEANKALLPALAESDAWLITAKGAFLKAFHKEHTFEGGVCTVCGEEQPPCSYHQWLPGTEGYTCAACGATAATLNAAITLKIEDVEIADGKATVTVSLAATEALKGLRFRIGAPEGLTYVSTETTLAAVPAPDAADVPRAFSFGEGTDAMALLNFDEQTLASFDKSNILKLTYTVDESFTTKTAVFTVELIEVLDDEVKALAADGIGYIWHQHDDTEVITKPATCGEAGEKKLTCKICGESRTEVIPATGNHTYGDWMTRREPTVGVPGEDYRICSVCGKEETRTTYVEKPGDLNGDGEVDKADVLLLQKHLAGWDVELKAALADVNGDGEVDKADVLLLQKYLAGWDVKFGK